MKKVITIITLIICFSTSAQEKDWVTYLGTTYTIDYPVSSVLVRIDLPNSDFTLISSDTKDNFRENLMVMIFNCSLSELKEKIEFSKRECENAGNLIQYEEVKINNKNTYHIIFKNESNDMKIIAEQYYWYKNDIAYVLTFAYEDKINNIHKNTGLKILETLKLL